MLKNGVYDTKLYFTDVTTAAGLDDFHYVNGLAGNFWLPETIGGGGGFIDYNNDGWLDLLLVGGGVFEGDERDVVGLHLYKNLGDGTFGVVTDEAGLGGIRAYGFGISVADYDNDGDKDFFLTTLQQNMLFENNHGVFREVSKESGLDSDREFSSTAVFFDANLDGWLDLYVGNFADWSPEAESWCSPDGMIQDYCSPKIFDGTPGRFYHNNGDRTFTDKTEEVGLVAPEGKTLGVAEFDYNSDGWPDLILANDQVRDVLFRNNGDGMFSECGLSSGIAYDEHGIARAGMGIDTGVVDGDGKETVFIGNFSKEMIGVYKYIGNDLFLDRSALSRIGKQSLLSLTFGLFLSDLDLDGDQDLFAGNGHVQLEIEREGQGILYREPPHLFLNNGDGVFEDIGPAIGGVLAKPIVARGAFYGDYDRDGDMDVVITDNGGPVYLWRNELKDGRYLRVDVQGVESNRDGLGAQLTAVVNGNRMLRRVRAGSGFLSTYEKTATFGLGSSSKVDTLRVSWPSGQVQEFYDVKANQTVLIIEGKSDYQFPAIPGE